MGKVIDAVYEEGVFKPLGRVELKDGERVKVEVRRNIFGILKGWKVDTQKLKDELGFQYGINKHVSPHTTSPKNKPKTQIVIASEPPIAATRITHGLSLMADPTPAAILQEGQDRSLSQFMLPYVLGKV
ncbi:MAG: antitoxin family protein [Candidatus Freyarchaeota archaeon]